MLGWNKITQLTSKAGGAVSKVKDFAKDLITVDPEETDNHINTNQDFQQAFAQLQKGYGLAQSPKETNKSPTEITRSPIEAASPTTSGQKIELQEMKKKDIDQPTFDDIQLLFKNTFQKISNELQVIESSKLKEGEQNENFLPETENNGKEDQPTSEISLNKIIQSAQQYHTQKINDIYQEAEITLHNMLQTISQNQQDQMAKLVEQISQEQQALSEVGVLINQFFNQIQRQSTFYERFTLLKQKGSNKELIGLIEKSLNNTGVEIISQKQDGQQNKKEQQYMNENLQLQKKIVELQDKVSNLNNQLKESQSRIKELEKYQSEWDKIKRDYTEEIKQNFTEVENLKLKLKQKEIDLQQGLSEVQKAQDLRTLLDQKTEEIERLEKLLEEWQQENQSLQNGIKALQLQLEAEKDQRDKMSKKYQEEFKKIRQEASKEDLSQLKFLKENNEKLKLNNSQLKLQLEELTIVNETVGRNFKELQSEAVALQNRIRQDQNYVNNMVDKRVVANFLIQYLDFGTEFKVKLQILETLSSLLDLTKDERDKISPYRNRQQQFQTSQQSSFRDKFIGFLKNGE